VTDRTAAALASALPAGISYILGSERDDWTAANIAHFQAERLAESGWRLVHEDDPPQSFAEHYAAALARVIDADQVHDHVEAGDED
jgi:hypothetical protein